MKVLLASSEFPPGPGGIGNHAYNLALSLAERQWDVLVVTNQDYANEDEVESFAEQQPFAVRRLGRTRGQLAMQRERFTALRAAIEAFAPDIVIASGLFTVWHCAAIVRLQPWIAIGHGKEFGTRGLQKKITAAAYRRASGVVCVSRYTRDRMFAAGIHPAKETVIPNGARIPNGGMSAAGFRQGHRLGGARVLLTVGHLSERKGQDIVVRALPKLAAHHNVVYVAAGVPTLKDRLDELARREGVSERLRTPGRLTEAELAGAYRASDVHVMTSRHDRHGDFEGYGIAAVEAAMHGRPSVVTAGSGLSEAVVDGETGIVVPRDDVDSTANALLRLLGDDALRERLGRAAKERAFSEQTWEARGAEYEGFLSEFLPTRAKAAR
jgi:phosphatidyl-myo-inositol dimannoside synthase